MRTDGLLLPNSSTDAAEAQLNAAVHRARAAAAACRAVGDSEAAKIVSRAGLLVPSRWCVAALAVSARCMSVVSVWVGD